MYLKSGYKTITGVQLLNGLALLEEKRITFRCFRVYLATFAAAAIREAASRARQGSIKPRGERAPRYRISELARLCRVTEGEARRDIRTLEREKLLRFSESEIVHFRDLLPEAMDIAALIRSPARPVPVPRRVLRFLARGKTQALSRAMIAYMLRGLTLAKKGGEISGKGSVKLSWIANVAGMSHRAAAYARKELIRMAWISADTGSKQWKLNRHGAYFCVNLDWADTPEATPSRASEIAPPPISKRPLFARPIEDRKTPYGSKNQKASSSGVLEKGEVEKRGALLRNVKREDLFSLWRCEELYWQAVNSGIIQHSESSVLNFLSAAVRARSVSQGDPARIFVSIIKRGLWAHLTSAQEEIARRGLWKAREGNPNAFRVQKWQCNPLDQEAA